MQEQLAFELTDWLKGGNSVATERTSIMKHKIIVVTPAGRRAYLDLLSRFILKDATIDEWHLWDNCRETADRDFIHRLARTSSKIKIIELGHGDGSNSAINKFYATTTDPSVFYIKMDDDIIWLPADFGGSLYKRAMAEKGKYLWWSPVVINNAICSWWLSANGVIDCNVGLTQNALCLNGWVNPVVAQQLHLLALEMLENNEFSQLAVPDTTSAGIRFSINCIGFFGDDALRIGEWFCPLGVDDEEWLTVNLPKRQSLQGRIIGALAVVHFAFFTQENYLLRTDILDRYYAISGGSRTERLPIERPRSRKESFRVALKLWWRNRNKAARIRLRAQM